MLYYDYKCNLWNILFNSRSLLIKNPIVADKIILIDVKIRFGCLERLVFLASISLRINFVILKNLFKQVMDLLAICKPFTVRNVSDDYDRVWLECYRCYLKDAASDADQPVLHELLLTDRNLLNSIVIYIKNT